jgi:hypothetical protein
MTKKQIYTTIAGIGLLGVGYAIYWYAQQGKLKMGVANPNLKPAITTTDTKAGLELQTAQNLAKILKSGDAVTNNDINPSQFIG